MIVLRFYCLYCRVTPCQLQRISGETLLVINTDNHKRSWKLARHSVTTHAQNGSTSNAPKYDLGWMRRRSERMTRLQTGRNCPQPGKLHSRRMQHADKQASIWQLGKKVCGILLSSGSLPAEPVWCRTDPTSPSESEAASPMPAPHVMQLITLTLQQQQAPPYHSACLSISQ